MILLIDIGNTRIKWARCDQRGLGAQSAAVHAEWGKDEARHRLLEGASHPDRMLVANVGGERIGELVRGVGEELGIAPEFVRATAELGGVRNAYLEPAKLGVDRWMCMIGARAMRSGPLCIASVGTATTVDAMDACGDHLGGVIVPGPDLMIASLLQNTSDIAARAQEGDVAGSVFANSTRGAIQQGAVHALAALIERSMAVLAHELDTAPALLLTGGASSCVAPFIGVDFESVPDLTLRGLAVVASAVPAA